MNFFDLFTQGDAVIRATAIVLLAMSIASWVVILWKAWLLQRAGKDVTRSTAAFWQSASIDEARGAVVAFDREALVLPLIAATRLESSRSTYAQGSLRAARFLATRKTGLFDMFDVLNLK